MATYVNDLRLTEIATGDETGDWGATTNTNLELIAEAFSFGTEAITTNADTHTTTIADGGTDPGRSIFLKYTGTLDSACTITIGPNTVSKLWFIENGTSGSQNIIISSGSGANITIPPGDTKAVYSDGAGSGAAMVDAFASLSVVDLKVQDDLTVTDDLIVNGDIDLEGSIDVNGTANLDVVDIDGAVQLDATLTVGANDQGYDVILYGDTAARHIAWDSSDDSLEFADNTKATFGSGADAQLYHDGTNSYITNSQGALKVATETSGIALAIGHSTSEVTFGDNVTVTGNFTVNGTTTTINTTNLTVTDPLVKFGQGYDGSAFDEGFIVTRGNGSATNTANKGFIWDESADEFAAVACNTEDGTTAGNVTINDYAPLHVGAITADDDSTFSGVVDITDTTDSSDATGDTGALRTEGGASIAKKLFTGDGITTSTAAGDNNFPLTAYHPTGTAARTIARFQSNVGSTGATVASITAGGKITATELDVSGAIDVDGTTNLDVVDIDGAVDMASTLAVAGVVTANAGVVVDEMTLDGDTLTATDTFTIDAVGNIDLDADGGQVSISDGGVEIGYLYNSSSDFIIQSAVSDKDIKIQGNDGGSTVTALALDMSNAGQAAFNKGATFGASVTAETDTDTSNTGNVTLDYAAHQNFVLTLTGNTTLVNPTTEVVGQSGFISFIQDGTGSRVLSVGNQYFCAGGDVIVLSTAANSIDIVPYVVIAAGKVCLGAPQLAFADAS